MAKVLGVDSPSASFFRVLVVPGSRRVSDLIFPDLSIQTTMRDYGFDSEYFKRFLSLGSSLL